MSVNIDNLDLDLGPDLDVEAALQQEIDRPRGRRIFTLGPNKVGTVRFPNFKCYAKFVVHGKRSTNKDERFRTPCLKIFQRECPYCDMSFEEKQAQSIYDQTMFAWQCYWYEADSWVVFAYPENKTTPIRDLYTMVTARKKRKPRPLEPEGLDWVFTQGAKEGMEREINTDPQEPSKFEKDIPEIWSKREIFLKWCRITTPELVGAESEATEASELSILSEP
jgi:hypothetical protein